VHPARPLSRARDAARILEERARALAVVEEVAPSSGRTVAAFVMGGYELAVPIEALSRAVDLGVVTEIPCGPEHLLGVIVVDNRLVSLLDVPAFLAFPTRGVGDITAALVVQHGGRQIALAAERLLRIAEMALSDEAAAPRLIDVAALFADARLSGRRS
jgi:purine-binding chemotaxis protein CheW